MPFYAVHEGLYEGVQTRLDLLRQACLNHDFEYVVIDSASCDYSDLPTLTKRDVLFQVSSGSQTLLSLLLNPHVTTPYIVNPELNFITSTVQWSVLHHKAGLVSPKTIYSLTNDRNLLKRYVDYLGGFPLIIKKIGGSRGIGTMKVEGWHGLLSLADYLVTTADTFIMRAFISGDYGVRAIILNGTILKASKFFYQENDFRNAAVLSNCRYESFKLDSQGSELCARALQVANLEFAGVDLIFDDEDTPHLLEVNYPTGFQSFMDDPQPVLSRLVSYLKHKSEK
jgi:glutathione synthase/RimK-type ligase-like ATP-grasp enzyme